MPEIPKPELSNLSPEQQAIADLSALVTHTLDAQDVAAQTLEDGSQERKSEVTPHFGPTLVETIAPDGTKHFQKTSLFTQSHDRGMMTWQWQEGGNVVDYDGKMEIAGDSHKAIEDEAGIKRVHSDVEYVVSQLPEQAARQKGRFGKMLGKLSIKH